MYDCQLGTADLHWRSVGEAKHRHYPALLTPAWGLSEWAFGAPLGHLRLTLLGGRRACTVADTCGHIL